jgi:tRNA (guanine10-N2)-dimethyltransferase
MLLLFELAKEYGVLPQDEVLSILWSEKIKFQVFESSEELVLVDTCSDSKQIKRIVDRLALSFVVDELLFWCDPDEQILREKLKEVELSSRGSVAVHAKNRSRIHDTKVIVNIVAQYFTKNRFVNLVNPDIDIRLMICDERWYVGRKISKLSRSVFEHRRAHHRPFFSPISLHPKLARALVNLSQINNKGTLLDPFCGTGGILIEAGMVGAFIYGNDVESKMIHGCANTLTHFGIDDFKLTIGDIETVIGIVPMVDAIVTDMPYGKSTTTRGESLQDLYHRAFETFTSVLKDDGVIIAGGSIPSLGDIGNEYFTVETVYPIRVHRSLTRYFIKGHL